MKINFLPFWVAMLHLTTKTTDWVERNEHTVYTTPSIHKCEHFCEIKRQWTLLALIQTYVYLFWRLDYIFKVYQELPQNRGYNASAIPVKSHASINWHFYFSSLTGSRYMYYDNYKSMVLLLKKLTCIRTSTKCISDIEFNSCLYACQEREFT